MVQEVNETQVERQEQLSDKVQFCDGKTAVMENAERREARLEKAKEAEKVTANWNRKSGSKRWNPWKTGKSQGRDQGKRGR